MVASAPNTRTRPNAAQKRVISKWLELAEDAKEKIVETSLVFPMLEVLGIKSQQIASCNIAIAGKPGLIPDVLVYQDLNQPPVLVIENKKRHPVLANASDTDFVSLCQQHLLYKEAVGYTSNGIQQYLNIDLIKPEFLASYGLVFSGDFFQLWRRVDGLIFPLTPIQRVTEASIPVLMQQLEYCLNNPQPALVSAVWNRKGGVAKTTNTLNIGATLALAGKKVLLVDLDPQQDLTKGLGLISRIPADYLKPCIDKFDLKEFEEVKSILDDRIQARTFPTTDSRGYSLSLLATNRESLEKFRDRHKDFSTAPAIVIKQIIKSLQSDYDYIFIDTSPSPDKLTESVLYSCDTVLVPFDFSDALHHAVEVYTQTVPKMRAIRSATEQLHLAPWNIGLVFSNCPADAGGLEKIAQAELEKRGFSGKQCETRLKTYAQTKIATFREAPVVCWQNSPITKLYSNLVNEVFLSHNFTDH